VKIPRFTFEKFPTADPNLSVSMKSVGEAMAIGRTFKEALQKGLRSLEIGVAGLEDLKYEVSHEQLIEKLKNPNAERIFYIKDALKKGMSIDEIYALTKIDRWFLYNIKEIVELEKELQPYKGKHISKIPTEIIQKSKEYGFSDKQLAKLFSMQEEEIYRLRKERGVSATFKSVDTCAAEFQAFTPYYYSTYETKNES
jgi:carbamoyl-phosphate synthase large subunit